MFPYKIRRSTDEARVGRSIRRARLVEGMSQASLAMRIGIGLEELQGYEMGALCIPNAVLAAVADCLDIPVSRLFGSVQDMEEASRPTPSARLH